MAEGGVLNILVFGAHPDDPDSSSGGVAALYIEIRGKAISPPSDAVLTMCPSSADSIIRGTKALIP